MALGQYATNLSVTGVDFCNEMLAKARERVHLRKLTQVKELRKMDAKAFDFPDDYFDTVVAMHVMSIVPDPERVVAEMARVIKPDGKVVMVNHFASGKGFVAAIERLTARFSNMLGWRSDFENAQILGVPGLAIAHGRSFQAFGIKTFLALQKTSLIAPTPRSA